MSPVPSVSKGTGAVSGLLLVLVPSRPEGQKRHLGKAMELRRNKQWQAPWAKYRWPLEIELHDTWTRHMDPNEWATPLDYDTT